MSLVLTCPTSCATAPWKSTRVVHGIGKQVSSSSSSSSFVKQRSNRSSRSSVAVKAFLYNPLDDPIVKEALKEPVAFMGGMFAGLLRLDLNEDPLKEWVTRTVEASGITKEEIEAEDAEPEEITQQIVIE